MTTGGRVPGKSGQHSVSSAHAHRLGGRDSRAGLDRPVASPNFRSATAGERPTGTSLLTPAAPGDARLSLPDGDVRGPGGELQAPNRTVAQGMGVRVCA